ncbi:hypothetical protein BaRGS_00003728, partial [Batillaria attramentaria]
SKDKSVSVSAAVGNGQDRNFKWTERTGFRLIVRMPSVCSPRGGATDEGSLIMVWLFPVIIATLAAGGGRIKSQPGRWMKARRRVDKGTTGESEDREQFMVKKARASSGKVEFLGLCRRCDPLIFEKFLAGNWKLGQPSVYLVLLGWKRYDSRVPAVDLLQSAVVRQVSSKAGGRSRKRSAERPSRCKIYIFCNLASQIYLS